MKPERVYMPIAVVSAGLGFIVLPVARVNWHTSSPVVNEYCLAC